MTFVRKISIIAIAFLVVVSASVFAADAADNYPQRPVTMVIPHKAGSSTDIVARCLQPYFQKYLGEKAVVVVENQEGGGGNAAHLKNFRAAPDGYTIELSPFPSAILGEMVKGGNFKTLQFTFLYNVTGSDFNGIFVKYDSPYKTIKDLVEASKKQKITMSGSGIGTNGHMAMKLLEADSGAHFEYVSFDGGTEAAIAVAGGHTVSGVGNLVALKQLAEEKRIKILAVIGDKRAEAFPDVPTAIEAGYTDAVMDVCVGVFGPPNMPAGIVKKLEEALRKAVSDPEFQKQAEKLGSNIVPLAPAEFRKLVEKIYKQADKVKAEMKPAK
jgi:tripartite-type tricarboxylate transporter receptor subunit TctC